MTSFKLVGLKLPGKTTNENGQSGRDCGSLWQRFETENIAQQIPHKLSEDVYAVYCDYDSDENGTFSYFIGCKVDDTLTTPPHLDVLDIPEQFYHIELAKGKMTGCLTDAWKRIWQSEIPRKFGYDFEIYSEKSRDWNDAEVDIYISVNTP